jgi:tyrosine-protein kinase Etk/Wzc
LNPGTTPPAELLHLQDHPISTDPTADDTPITVLEVLTHLGRQKWVIAACVALGTAWGGYHALQTKPVFTAQAAVLQPKQGSNGSAATAALASLAGAAGGGQLAALAGLGGVALGGGDDFFPALLRTQVAQAWIVNQLKLKERWNAPSDEAAQRRVAGSVGASIDRKTGMLMVAGYAPTAEEAAELANSAVLGLRAALGRLSVTEAQNRRAFYEAEIPKTEAELRKLEQRFIASRERAGLQSFTALAESGLRTSTELRARLMAREMELQGARHFAGPQNADVLRLENEVRTLQAELRRFETGRAPAQQLSPEHAQALQDFRELKTQEALLESFSRQLAAARFDEARDGPLVQVVDDATPSRAFTSTNRKKMVLVAAGVGLLAGVLLALLRAWWMYAMQQASTRASLHKLRQAWLGRGGEVT